MIKDTYENILHNFLQNERIYRIQTLRIMENDAFLPAATLSTELSILTTKTFQNHTFPLNMPPKCFDFNVYKQTNVNIVITFWQHYNI